MKKIILYAVLIIAAIGLLTNMDYFLNMIVNSLIFLIVLGLIIYGVYYFFVLTPSQRKYRKALRKSKRKYKQKNRR
ncbi:membrane protein [Salinicoccus sediminis]|uniref:Membrane protein n=1 Tax=Salinicoccus sediminis TaxID=1432562 RepID=A0A0M2SLH5_9STAP|nr:SA1362 family protein [Salinicoccus sediminis]KKK35534.1 membrane protein [Salinicoccus sediminis]